ncbi:endonuclease/exonuclease/phosphatase family protein [Mycobacterium intracellulare]|uniref:endonuclease/exonuclease/phosphatase family protein n=1 Tax=Mycobacterium intracellulare TaxID=1767 RepID=UPI002E796E5D|nr:endonuclease/exonuclease/phosphatase family protein [Mycobacterium intracellulare]
MILLTWNIRQGGGSRVSSICHHVEDVRPDLLAFTEFQARNEASLRAHLDRLGYPFVMTSKPIANHNGLLVACRWPIEHAPMTTHSVPTRNGGSRFVSMSSTSTYWLCTSGSS